jgi:hypothetical protein
LIDEIDNYTLYDEYDYIDVIDNVGTHDIEEEGKKEISNKRFYDCVSVCHVLNPLQEMSTPVIHKSQ